MSEIVTEIEKRRSYRAVDSKRVEDDVIDRILTAATYAPSCANNQSWRFIAISDSSVLNTVKKHLSGGNYWAKLSPFIVLVCTKAEYDCQLSDGRDYALFDTGLATQNLLLQAVSEGLYAHPIAGFDPEPIKTTIGIPEDTVLITLIICGYPGDPAPLSEKHKTQESAPRERKDQSEVVAYDRWPASWE